MRPIVRAIGLDRFLNTPRPWRLGDRGSERPNRVTRFCELFFFTDHHSALLAATWSNPFSLLERTSKDPRPPSLLLRPESEYCGSPIGPRERRTGTAYSAARS